MKWIGLANSLGMSALGLNCGKRRAFPSRLVCETNLPEGGDRKIRTDLNQKTCTHRGGPLSEGDVQGTRVTCPWHGADFDLKTGALLGPPAQKGVPSYKVVVEGDDIKIEV
jgi:Rieske Fe-S protein